MPGHDRLGICLTSLAGHFAADRLAALVAEVDEKVRALWRLVHP